MGIGHRSKQQPELSQKSLRFGEGAFEDEGMVSKRLYRLISGENHSVCRDNSRTKVIEVSGVRIGEKRPVVIAGPCAVESREQTLEIAHAVKEAGADMLRGGAYKPRSNPYSFQGLREKGLKILAEAKEETGLPIVTEVMDPRLVPLVGQYADVLQIGSRSMQNFPLLVEIGQYCKPVLLKRGMSATLEEWLGAAEYVAKEGNTQVILCERGVRTALSGQYDRFTLDLNVIEPVKRHTFLPIIVDPSHATGVREMVPGAARAAISYGAHGLLIEVIGEYTDPSTIKCDGEQGIRPSVLRKLIEDIGFSWRSLG